MKKAVIIIFLLSIFRVFSATISYNDKFIERGKIDTIQFTIENGLDKISISNEVSIVLNYNAYMINPINIFGSNISVEDFAFELNQNDLRNSSMSFTFVVNNISNEIQNLFNIEFESLASQDSISSISLSLFKIDNKIEQIEYIPGLIRTQNLVFNKIDFVSEVYPNPFNYQSKLNLTINNESVVELSIFSIDSRSLDFNIENQNFLIEIFNEIGQKIKLSENIKLEPGKYTFTFLPNRNFIANGAYQLRLKINDSFYYKNFIFEG